MPRNNGQHLSAAIRNQAIQTAQSLIAAGIPDDEIRQQLEDRYQVSDRTVRDWLARAYAGLAAEVEEDRRQLLGVALRRRRIVMARTAKKGDWKTYLAASDSEARLLGLEAPRQLEHHVLVQKAKDLSEAVVDVVKTFFADDPFGRQRFVRVLRERLNLTLLQRRSPGLLLDTREADPDPKNREVSPDGNDAEAELDRRDTDPTSLGRPAPEEEALG